MKRAYTAHQVRDAEAPLLAAGNPLMQQAAFALAGKIKAVLRQRHGKVLGTQVVLLVGSGNNGGDALVAGAMLQRAGVQVSAWQLNDRIYEPGAIELTKAGGEIIRVRLGEPLPNYRRVDIVVDGILGIGAADHKLTLRPLAREVISWAHAQAPAAALVAVDLPSGIHPDTGEVAVGAFHADYTVTFGAYKRGALLAPAAALCGEMTLVDIGLGPYLPDTAALLSLDQADAGYLWPWPRVNDHKYSRGVLGVIAGSSSYPGAAVLTCQGAAGAGAGMIRYLGPRDVLRQVLAARPEIVGVQGKVGAWAIGAGLDPSVDDGQHVRAKAVLKGARTAVVDAGALDLIRADDRLNSDCVLTPHATEAARLASKFGYPMSAAVVQQRPAEVASLLARVSGATVLLKGHTTIIARGDDPNRLLSQTNGTAFLATAGSGDVLSGVIGTLLAAGQSGPYAAALGAYIHGRAGQIAARESSAPVTASQVAAAIPVAISELKPYQPAMPKPVGGEVF